LHSLAKGLVEHGQIRTTLARAKEAQRLADRLVTMGKDGSIHSRRLAYRVLQNRTLVKRLFGEIAPRYVDVAGGYTRVTRLGLRPGDGAQQALLALSRLPAPETVPVPGAKPSQTPQPSAPKKPQVPAPKSGDEGDKDKGFLGGLRNIWTRKKKGSAA
jgi:large subunit ribosomal protein L17